MIYFRTVLFGLLFISCGSLKQPSEKEYISLLTQVIEDLATNKEFEYLNPFVVIETEYTKSITGDYSHFDFEYFCKNNNIIFNHFLKCDKDLENTFNIKGNREYYDEQNLVSNEILQKIIKKSNNPITLKKNDFFKVSRPLFSPNKDVVIVLLEVRRLGGGLLKIYKLINNQWVETCVYRSSIWD